MSHVLSSQGGRTLVAFDVDGTLTWADSFMLFLRFVAGRRRFFWGLMGLAWPFLLYVLGLRSRDATKNALLATFLAGMGRETYVRRCEVFARLAYPLIVRADGLAALRAHQTAGDEIALVSASLEDYLLPWAASLGVEAVLATRLADEKGLLCGTMDGPNCRCAQKLVRIQDHFDTGELAAAYGDSRGDQEMLAAATKPGYRVFHDRPARPRARLLALYLGTELERRAADLARGDLPA
jgi:HAD superfamily hydrolase (TIGR01490 family)